jgi:hypothetical protein
LRRLAELDLVLDWVERDIFADPRSQ